VALILKACGDRLIPAGGGLLEAAAATAAKAAITVYDAAYVVAARSRGDQLVSTDLRDLLRPGLAIAPADAV
jgi:predicted nucleic acid-binding protein